MTEADRALVQALLDEWFGELGPNGEVPADKSVRWWKKDAAFDTYLEERYGKSVGAAIEGRLQHWEAGDESLLALVLLLDQLPRNIYRNTSRMYAGDDQALASSLRFIDAKRHHSLPAMQQTFVLMPLMHSEGLADQKRALVEFAALHDRAHPSLKETLASSVRYAQAHYDIVERFGRFPHRNSILGRSSTPEEIEFLTTPGSSF